MLILINVARFLVVSSFVVDVAGAASAQTAAPAPKPTESQASVRADLGNLDALAQQAVEAGAEAGTTNTGALDAVQDAIGARSTPCFRLAIPWADPTLGSVEKAIDTEGPPWRRFLHSVGF